MGCEELLKEHLLDFLSGSGGCSTMEDDKKPTSGLPPCDGKPDVKTFDALGRNGILNLPRSILAMVSGSSNLSSRFMSLRVGFGESKLETSQ